MRAAWITLQERREKRGREKEREEEETDGGLSFSLVALNRLARLNRVVCSGATEAQLAHGEWGVGRATAVGATKSCEAVLRE
jgi:hypothetical protein